MTGSQTRRTGSRDSVRRLGRSLLRCAVSFCAWARVQMADVVAARAALAVGKTFRTFGDIDTALEPLRQAYPSHLWSLTSALQGRLEVAQLGCSRDRKMRPRCSIRLRVTRPASPPGASWSANTIGMWLNVPGRS